jgi:membrane-associated PAP2 superfamily phosphatase
MTAIEPGRADRGLLADPIAIAFLYCAVVSVVFLLFPGIDLWATALFYDPAAGFTAAASPALRLLRSSGDWAMEIVAVVLVVSLLAKIAMPSRRSLIPPSVSLFLLATLAFATGLVVNAILKDLWGRPRPRMVTEFGGNAPYVEVWRISGECLRNCSFVAGEASSALWLVVIAFVVPRRYRLPVLVVTGLFALALSINRIAFGAHFLSDVLLSWGLTALVAAVLYRLFIDRPPPWLENQRIEAALGRLGEAVRRPFVRQRKGESERHQTQHGAH